MDRDGRKPRVNKVQTGLRSGEVMAHGQER